MVARPHRPAVAVVGGTGCVGQHICAAFAQAGYQVVALARRPPGRAEGRGLPPDATFVSCDVAAATPARLAAMLAAHEVSVIIHATGGWGLSEREMRTAPGQVVTRLVEAISRLPYRPRLVHVGTIHEYGPVPPDVAITERTVPAPQTLYARTKLAESGYVLERVAAGHLDGVVLRLVNTFGPYPAPGEFPDLCDPASARRGTGGAAEPSPMRAGIIWTPATPRRPCWPPPGYAAPTRWSTWARGTR